MSELDSEHEDKTYILGYFFKGPIMSLEKLSKQQGKENMPSEPSTV